MTKSGRQLKRWSELLCAFLMSPFSINIPQATPILFFSIFCLLNLVLVLLTSILYRILHLLRVRNNVESLVTTTAKYNLIVIANHFP